MKILKSMLPLAIANFIVLFFITLGLPAEIPNHLNANMIIDGYATKWIVVITGFIPIILATAAVIYQYAASKKGITKNQKVINILIPLVILVVTTVTWAPVIIALRYDLGIGAKINFPLDFMIAFPIGVLAIILSNFLGVIQHNYWFGIRTPWTLASESVWKKTHRFGGFTGVVGGIIICCCSIISLIVTIPLISYVGLLVGTVMFGIVPCVYSFIISKK